MSIAPRLVATPLRASLLLRPVLAASGCQPSRPLPHLTTCIRLSCRGMSSQSPQPSDYEKKMHRRFRWKYLWAPLLLCSVVVWNTFPGWSNTTTNAHVEYVANLFNRARASGNHLVLREACFRAARHRNRFLESEFLDLGPLPALPAEYEQSHGMVLDPNDTLILASPPENDGIRFFFVVVNAEISDAAATLRMLERGETRPTPENDRFSAIIARLERQLRVWKASTQLDDRFPVRVTLLFRENFLVVGYQIGQMSNLRWGRWIKPLRQIPITDRSPFDPTLGLDIGHLAWTTTWEDGVDFSGDIHRQL